MDFEKALVYELQIISDLTGKIFPQHAKENIKPPFVVYISSEGEPIMTLAGATDLTEVTCEIHVVAENYDQMKSVTKAVLDQVRSFFQRPIGGDLALVIKSISYLEPVEDIDNNTNYHKSSFDIHVRF